jgi:hypothetical protein
MQNSFRPYRSFPENIINNADQKEGKCSQKPVGTPFCNIALIYMKTILNIHAIRVKFEQISFWQPILTPILVEDWIHTKDTQVFTSAIWDTKQDKTDVIFTEQKLLKIQTHEIFFSHFLHVPGACNSRFKFYFLAVRQNHFAWTWSTEKSYNSSM